MFGSLFIDMREVFELFDFLEEQSGLNSIRYFSYDIGVRPVRFLERTRWTDFSSLYIDMREVFGLFDSWDGRDGLISYRYL